MRATTRLRRRIAEERLLLAPGVYDGLSARLAADVGFEAIYATGGGIARGRGIPDLGLLGVTEVADRMAEICDASPVPVIADIDNGYGNALNAQRAARLFERAGVAGFHIEDQTFPKRCGHYEDKRVVPVAEFAGKLRAVKDALTDADTVVIARTDAIAVEGFEAAIGRCLAYAEAGADVLFLDAPTSEEQIAEAARRLPRPTLINMFHGGKTPLVGLARLEELGYRIVIVPGDAQRAAIHAMRHAFEVIKRDGNTAAMANDMASFEDRERAVATDEFVARGRRYDA